ncbi:hypothetical protein V8E36_005391 [Tilletia maclaganii]
MGDAVDTSPTSRFPTGPSLVKSHPTLILRPSSTLFRAFPLRVPRQDINDTTPQSTQGHAPPPASQVRAQIRRLFNHDFASQDTLAPACANPFSADAVQRGSPTRAGGASTRLSDVRRSGAEIATAQNTRDQQASLDRSQRERSPSANGDGRLAAAASLTRLSNGASRLQPPPPGTTLSTSPFVAEGVGSFIGYIHAVGCARPRRLSIGTGPPGPSSTTQTPILTVVHDEIFFEQQSYYLSVAPGVEVSLLCAALIVLDELHELEQNKEQRG